MPGPDLIHKVKFRTTEQVKRCLKKPDLLFSLRHHMEAEVQKLLILVTGEKKKPQKQEEKDLYAITQNG